ncbi:TetR/AcrR family transcriptional regulator [Mucilaginibacter sp. E4BP6]|uniref:TetR/AcrR family transcriptional regulator n=1 Tax=Mucilaginibacter sp. E4BP6 TaxID=2723089 RepID=UPI0015C920F5|nr:TetR/AcrR family transcriptional regulator [Mucilaginibacter sp. E4BP6]NYE66998.1 AcrR family transcriptional regulator [Mucilaginibacter sp. E4BP6]
MKISATRARILDVASRLFYEQGYNSTGINQIIDEADIARGSLYNHFPSKRDLLTAYVQQAEELWFAELEQFTGPLTDPKDRLLALFDYRIARQLGSGFGGCQFTKIGVEVAKDDLAAFELLRHQKERIKHYIKDLLTKIDVSGIVSKELLANNFFLIMEGATVSAREYKDAAPLYEAKKIAEELLNI